ncbi:MAG: heparinase II/III-family protein [Lachnospiraceae bacterium]|nr:heparinase II/III-family protein [Lachnospiraceae bacterium]
MKKSVMCILLAIVLIIGVMPISVYAADPYPNAGKFGSFAGGDSLISDMIKNGKNAHPRLIMTEEKFQKLRKHIDDGSTTAVLLENLRREANNYLDDKVAEYTLDDDHLLETSKRVQRRVATLSLAYNIFGKEDYAVRCYAEMEAACSFKDWSPVHFLDTAEMCTAMAYGYDWLYNWMDSSQRKKVRDALITRGLNQVMSDYKKETSDDTRTYQWYKRWEENPVGDNWQLVCTGGINLAALAIGDEDEAREISATVLTYGYERAYSFVRVGYSALDGTYLEGLGYWDYATYYLGLQSSALITATGTDYGLADYEGVRKSVDFVRYMSSNVPLSFSFGDDNDSRDTGWAVFLWLGEYLNSSEISEVRLRKITSKTEFNYLDVLWIDESNRTGDENQNDTDWAMVGASNASFRTSWDQSGLVAALHTGVNDLMYHGHFDLGSFYIESNGARFFTDLGNENYKLDNREYSYRLKPEGHNTLTINPSEGTDQVNGAFCVITECAKGNEAYAVTDLTEAYADNDAKSVIRALKMVKDKKCVIVQDEISLNKEGEIYWFAHTKGDIAVAEDYKSAVVTVGSERLWVGLLTEGGQFTTMDAVPLSTSLNVPGAKDNTGYRKLVLHLTNVKDTTISVACVVLKNGESAPEWIPSVKAISEWSSQSGGGEEEHNYVDIGNGVHKCTICGDSGKHDFINADGTNNPSKNACSLCNVKNINYTSLDSKVVSKTSEYTGKAITADVSVTGLVNGTDYTVEKVSKTEPGEYDVKVTGKGNYAGERIVTWKIVAGEPVLTLPTPSGKYKQKLSDVNLTNPSGNVKGTWTWKNPNEVLSKVGEFEYSASFTPSNTVHWYPVDRKIKVKVGKASGIVTEKYSKEYLYNNEYADEIIDLSGFAPADASNVKFAVSGRTYTGSDTVSSAAVDKNKLKFTVARMSAYSEKTSTTIKIKISSDNYEDYIQEIVIARNRLNAPNEGLWCEEIPDQIYTGKAIKPELEVYCDGIKLVPGTDYTLTYKNNVKVAAADAKNSKGKSTAPSVTIKGKGNYSDKMTLKFAIVKRSIDTASVENITVKETGKRIKIKPVITLDGRKLKAGTDYVISTGKDAADTVTGYKEAGTYNLYAVAKGNYSGCVPFSFTITSSIPASNVKIGGIADQRYNEGKEIKPEVTVTYNKADVTEYFTVSYANNKQIGTATVTITAKADSGFVGTKKATFKITGTQMKNAKLGADGKGTIPAVVYNGKAYEPVPDLYMGSTPLVKNTDYTVSYSDNVNAGTGTVKVTGKGKYTGSKSFTFKINRFDVGNDADGLISVNNGNPIRVKYEKGGVTPRPTVKLNGKTLNEKKDYTLSYANNNAVAGPDAVNAKGKSAAPTITVTLKGNYSGKKTVKFEITAGDIKECKITVPDREFSTKANAWKQKNATIVDTNGRKLVAGTDYVKKFRYFSDVSCSDEISAQTLDSNTIVYVKVEGTGNYAGTNIIGNYRISRFNISKASASIPSQIFTGKEICPTADEIKIKVGSGKTKTELKPGEDYDILPGTYTKNINKGTASVTVVGKGDYCGTKTVKFKIRAKKFLWWEL